jgi:hypothetical protein
MLPRLFPLFHSLPKIARAVISLDAQKLVDDPGRAGLNHPGPDPARARGRVMPEVSPPTSPRLS